MKKGIFVILFLSTLFFARGQSQYRAKTVVSWLGNAVIYQIWLRSFTKEGTLAAAEKRIPEIASLGATVIYLPPLFTADTDMRKEYWSNRQKASPENSPRNPYRSGNYTVIDPQYGTEVDLKNFIAAAHAQGLKVMMDLVYLHTGPSNVLVAYPDYYHRDSSGRFIKNPWNFLWLNYDSEGLREYLYKDMEHWIGECKADGFRCDVSFGIPLDFWEEARRRLEVINPEVGMLAESAFNTKEQVTAFDASYSFPWYETVADVVAKGKSASRLQKMWGQMNRYYAKGARFIRYSDNHDLNRTDMVFGERGSRAVNIMNFMLDGIPFIYNGQEIGDGSPFGIFTHWPILWESEGLPLKKNLKEWYRQLIAFRKQHSFLSDAETIWLVTSKPNSVIAFLRKKGARQLLTVVNLRNEISEVMVTLPSVETFKPAITAGEIKISNGRQIKFQLNSFGYYTGLNADK